MIKKEKCRSSNSKNARNSFLNSRSIVLITGLAALLSGASIFYFNQPKKEDVLFINNKYNDEEIRRSWIFIGKPDDVELSQKEEFDLTASLMMEFGASLKDVVIDRLTRQSWAVPFHSQKDFSQSQEELSGYIDDLFNFVNHPKIVKPQIRLNISRKEDNIIDVNEGDVLEVYAVRLLGDLLRVYYAIKINDQIISGDSDKLFYHRGYTGSFYEYNLDHNLKRLVFLKQTRGNIFYAPKGALDRIDTVPIECLHRAFAPWTAANLHRDVDRYYKYDDPSNDIVPLMIERNTKMEEGIVHAIGYLWLKQNLNKFPAIINRDLEKTLERYTLNEIYKMVHPYLEAIQINGLERTIEMYTTGQL